MPLPSIPPVEPFEQLPCPLGPTPPPHHVTNGDLPISVSSLRLSRRKQTTLAEFATSGSSASLTPNRTWNSGTSSVSLWIILTYFLT
ncbi:hypothetical protein JTE90_011177 [Oedothorax gibbosus]|uniref:Uncharacterized protein n=1 Tax=Oedothorax gibbosus TaxID=931172 RepID=A0AAV6VZG5_9ARAC|nr:hypothetical protein JTE90_011177 [Oedothorax gibbosus]